MYYILQVDASEKNTNKRFARMDINGWRYETLGISKHKAINPLNRWLNVISFKYSTIRAMFYNRVLACRAFVYLIRVNVLHYFIL